MTSLKRSEFSMHRDGSGFSVGWYPRVNDAWQLGLMAIYGYAYHLDFAFPVIGDVRIGYRARAARRNPYQRYDARRFVFDRRPFRD